MPDTKISASDILDEYEMYKTRRAMVQQPAQKPGQKYFTIFGERCSGTNYLEKLIKANFDIDVTWDHCWKHFFGHNTFSPIADDTLFIGIIRNEIDWLNSFYRQKYHVSPKLHTLPEFLFNKFYSVRDDGSIMLGDLNYNTLDKYSNIFELRRMKNEYLTNIMPQKVKNYMVLDYDDLCVNYSSILDIIQKKFNLTPINDTYINIYTYKGFKKGTFTRKENTITYEQIIELAAERNIVFTPTTTKFGTSTLTSSI
jgi:hypothetical protein